MKETPPSTDAPPPESDIATEQPEAPPFRLRDVLQILGIALLIALGLRTFVLEGFRIPTESMERSLLVGDFVLVSKLHYGPRLPLSVGVPLTDWYLHDVHLPDVRLPGFTTIHRGDVVVFNYPVDDELIDRKMHYIKRVVGLPGDSVALRDKQLFVNGAAVPLRETMQQRWVATTTPGLIFPLDSLQALGASQVTLLEHEGSVTFEATRSLAGDVGRWEGVTGVSPYVQVRDTGQRIFPRGSSFGRDHYGPLYIPTRGDTITLTEANWLTYQDLIERYEHHEARVLPGGRFRIDSVETNRYVIEQDYYFVLGDNRDSSVDSRVWGFVPMDHVVGKAIFIYFSWDPEAGRIRLERFFKGTG